MNKSFDFGIQMNKIRAVLHTLNPRSSFRARIAFILALLTLALSMTLTLITGEISGQQLNHRIGQTLTQLAFNAVEQIDRTIFEQWRELQITASQSVSLISSNDLSALRILLTQMQQASRGLAWVGWIDPTGKVSVSTDAKSEGESVADQAWFQQAQAAKTPFIANLANSLISNNPQNTIGSTIDLAVPIRDHDETLLGVLSVQLDWQVTQDQARNLERRFARQVEMSGLAENVEVFILAGDGTVLVGGLDSNTPKLSQLQLQSVRMARTGESGFVEETWPDTNMSYLTGFALDNGDNNRGFRGSGLIALVRQRADVALASVTQLQMLLLAAGGLFAVIFSVIGWVLAGRITHPLELIFKRARELKTGNIHNTLPAPTGRIDDVTVLSNAIDQLLASLNTRNTELTDLNNNLEKITQERTAELSASKRFNEKMVDLVPDMVYIYDIKQGNIVYSNPAVVSVSGFSLDDIQTFSFLTPKAIHSDDIANYLVCLERIRHAPDGTLVELTYRLQHKEGHWIWINARETVFQRDANGSVDQVFGVARDITVQKRSEDEIQEMAAAQERQRLARELHDSVTQTLFSATMVTQTLPLIWDKGEAVVKKNLDELARLTFGALAEMRTLLNELRPNAIATADLGELLNQLVDAARGRSQAEFSLSIDGNEQFSPEVHLAVYRIAQEALNNCTKHARAHHVNVQLSRHDGRVNLRISDDGRGFNDDLTSAIHFGLEIMRERAAEVGGEISVHSQSAKGTEVVFSWSPSTTVQTAKTIEAQV